MREVADRVHGVNPRALVIAESGLNDPKVTRPPDEGGWATTGSGPTTSTTPCGSCSPATATATTRSSATSRSSPRPSGARSCTTAATRPSAGGASAPRPATARPTQFVVFSQNHDQVGNRAFGDRMPSEARALAAFVTLLSPFVPMLFMGEEHGEESPFQFFTDHIDEDIAERDARGAPPRVRVVRRLRRRGGPRSAGPRRPSERSKLTRRGDPALRDLYKRLLEVRRELPAGIEVDGVDFDRATPWLHVRRGPFVLAANFGADEAGVPAGDSGEVVLATHEARLDDGEVVLPGRARSAAAMSEHEGWPGKPFPLGATWDGEGTNFSLFTENAAGVSCRLFDDAGAEEHIEITELTAHNWHVLRARASGPASATATASRVPTSRRRATASTPTSCSSIPTPRRSRAACAGTRPTSCPTRPTAPATRTSSATTRTTPRRSRSRSSSTRASTGRATARRAGRGTRPSSTRRTSSGFTMRHPGVREDLRGTYAGLASEEALGSLQRLGVTAVELLPIHHIADEHFLHERGLSNYWGYSSIGYLAPHADYAATGRRGEQVREFKGMVKALHRAGIEVILDVVYNHTAEGNHLGPMLCFKGVDNASYYRLMPDDPRHYMDFTGTGNSLNVVHPSVLRLIMDSLRYWAIECHVDGFRFDLASALARELYDVDRLSAFFDVIHQDPVLSQVKLIAEPWDVGPGGYQVGNFPVLWSEWNGIYRDVVRDFWRGAASVAEFASRFTGSSDLYESDGRQPFASINFITAHDGFTLRDLVSYNDKHNEANQEDNRDGTDDNRSWNCGVEGETDDPEVNALRERQQRNFLATLFLSQGVPMLLGGDEIGRTPGRQQQRLVPGQRDLLVRLGPARPPGRALRLHAAPDRAAPRPPRVPPRALPGRARAGRLGAARRVVVPPRRAPHDPARLGGARPRARRVPQRPGDRRPHRARRASSRTTRSCCSSTPTTRTRRSRCRRGASARSGPTSCARTTRPLRAREEPLRGARAGPRALAVDEAAAAALVRATYRLQLTPDFGFAAVARARALPARPRDLAPVPVALAAGARGLDARLRRRRPDARVRRARRRGGPARAARRRAWGSCSTSCPTTWAPSTRTAGGPTRSCARASSTGTRATAGTGASSTSTTSRRCASRTRRSSRTLHAQGARARRATTSSTACASTTPTASPTPPATCAGCATPGAEHVWVEKILVRPTRPSRCATGRWRAPSATSSSTTRRRCSSTRPARRRSPTCSPS